MMDFVADETVWLMLMFLEVPETFGPVFLVSKRLNRVLRSEVFWSEAYRVDFQRHGAVSKVEDDAEMILPMRASRVRSWPGIFEGDAKLRIQKVSEGFFRVNYDRSRYDGRSNLCVRATEPFDVGSGFFAVPTMRQEKAVWRVSRTAYFEILLTKSESPQRRQRRSRAPACVAIGLCDADFGKGLMPGWDAHSFGLHSDDGHRFHASGQGLPFTRPSAVGDVLGAGILFSQDATYIFYTRNGTLLGILPVVAKTHLPLYPVVGIDDPDLGCDINLGFTRAFVYDLFANEENLRATALRAPTKVNSARSLRTAVRQLLMTAAIRR